MHINKYSLFCQFCTLLSTSHPVIFINWCFHLVKSFYSDNYFCTHLSVQFLPLKLSQSVKIWEKKNKTKKCLTNNTLRLPTPNPTVKACKLHDQFNNCVPNALLPNQRFKRERKQSQLSGWEGLRVKEEGPEGVKTCI